MLICIHMILRRCWYFRTNRNMFYMMLCLAQKKTNIVSGKKIMSVPVVIFEANSKAPARQREILKVGHRCRKTICRMWTMKS